MFILVREFGTDPNHFSRTFYSGARVRFTQLRGEAKVFHRRQDADGMATRLRARYEGAYRVERLYP